MRFVCLVSLRRVDGEQRFVYGNALPDRADLVESAGWSSLQESLPGGRSVRRYTCALRDEAYEALLASLRTGAPISLALTDGSSVALRARSRMIERPAVRASSSDAQRYSPMLEYDEYHRVLWNGEPRAFFDDVLAAVVRMPSTRAADLRKFAAALGRLVPPVPFTRGQFWRIGCFEIVDYVVDGGRNNDLAVDLINDEPGPRLRLSLRGPLATLATFIRVRAEGGADPESALPFLDRVLTVDGGTDFVVDLAERGLTFHVDVYGGPDNLCLRSHRSTRIAGFSIMSFVQPEGGWLDNLPEELRASATSGIATHYPGVSESDPWTTAQATAAAYERLYFPPRAPGYHLLEEPQAQRNYLRAILASAGSGIVTIADPYFDATALREHFVGRRDVVAEVVVVTSLRDETVADRALAIEQPPRDEAEELAYGAAAGQTEGDDLEDDVDADALEEVPLSTLQALLELARERHNDLPRRMRIINVQNRRKGAGRQFHDRFIHVRGPRDFEALWWLGNSLNSVGARRYPLFLTEVQGVQRIEYAEYVRALGDGLVAQRPNACARMHWENRWTYTPPPSVTENDPELYAFSGWERVVALLGGLVGVAVETSTPEATAATVEALASVNLMTRVGECVTWRLPDAERERVAAAVAPLLENGTPDEIVQRVDDLAAWAAHGGLPAEELRLSRGTVAMLLDFICAHIESLAASDANAWPRTEPHIENAIDDAVSRLEGGPYTRASQNPMLPFVRDVAIANAPEAYWLFVARCRREPVYESVTAYNWEPARQADASALALGDTTLVAQIVAVHLESRAPERAGTALRAASLDSTDRALALTRVIVDARPPLAETWPLLEQTWHGVLMSDAAATRIAAVLDRHHAGSAIDLLAELANVHPECPRLREDLIARWTCYLGLRGVAGPTPGALDGYARSVAADPHTADIVVAQFVAQGDAPVRFNQAILAALDLRSLTGVFARRANYDAWHDAGTRGARVVFGACRIMLLTTDRDILPSATAQLVSTLNKNDWGDTGGDLTAINAAISLAIAAPGRPALAAPLTELLGSAGVPASLRFAAALWADDKPAAIDARCADIHLGHVVAHVLPGHEAVLIDAFIRRLEAVAPDSRTHQRVREYRETSET